MTDSQEFAVHKLAFGEYVKSFDCGDDDLNDFIVNEAPLYRKSLLAVTYVMVRMSDPLKVVAFCSLANDRISVADFEQKTDFNRFRRKQDIPQPKRIKSYPAVKVCRLAVDDSVKGLHLGTKMLDFIKGYFVSDNKTGCRFITVDAYLDAIPFYLKNGFKPLNEDDANSEYTRLLFFDLYSLM